MAASLPADSCGADLWSKAADFDGVKAPQILSREQSPQLTVSRCWSTEGIQVAARKSIPIFCVDQYMFICKWLDVVPWSKPLVSKSGCENSEIKRKAAKKFFTDHQANKIVVKSALKPALTGMINGAFSSRPPCAGGK